MAIKSEELSYVNTHVWIPELILTMKKDGNIHDTFPFSIYLRAAFTSLAVDIGGGIYSRAAFNQGWRLIE